MERTKGKHNKQNVITSFLTQLRKKISGYFEPEEVEVTFEEDHGKKAGYTYTKVQHKQVA